MANRLRQHKNILYQLERDFGGTVVFHIPTINTYGITSGVTTRAFTDITTRKTIVLPNRLTREFVYDLSFIASNKNFTYGGFFDQSVKRMIVRRKQLRVATVQYAPELNWTCTYKDITYTVKEVNETEDGAGYILVCNTVDKEA